MRAQASEKFTDQFLRFRFLAASRRIEVEIWTCAKCPDCTWLTERDSYFVEELILSLISFLES
jgi:hypothetical protein